MPVLKFQIEVQICPKKVLMVKIYHGDKSEHIMHSLREKLQKFELEEDEM